MVLGWCNPHYQRRKKYGDPLEGSPLRISSSEAESLLLQGLKKCTGCREVKPLDQFHSWLGAKDGRMTRCKTCRRPSARKEWCAGVGSRYPGHEYLWQISESRSRPVKVCPDHSAEIVGQKACPICEEVLPTADFETSNTSRDGFREQCRACRQASWKRWRKENREKVYDGNNARRAVKKGSKNVSSGLSWKSIAQRDGMHCAYCKILTSSEDKTWGTWGPTHPTLDHVVPLTSGGDHTLDNAVLACGECNISKNKKTLEVWYVTGGPPRLRGRA